MIAEETRRRVADAAREYHFSRNVSAQRLTNQASKTIAFVTHTVTDSCQAGDLFGLEIMGGVSQGLHDLGYEMMVKPIDYKDNSWVRKLLDSRQVDGFVLMTSTRKSHHIKALIQEKAPFITWGAATILAGFPSVSADDFKGGFLVGQYLASLGDGPLAVIAGPSEEVEVQNRLQGFQSALSDAGREFDPAFLRFGDYSEEAGKAKMIELLGLRPRPRGVFAHSDLMAIGALKAAKGTVDFGSRRDCGRWFRRSDPGFLCGAKSNDGQPPYFRSGKGLGARTCPLHWDRAGQPRGDARGAGSTGIGLTFLF